MAIPANFTGGLQVLIERLQSGSANAADQAWAAKLLATASRLPKRLTTPYMLTVAARNHRIFLDVCAEAGEAPTDADITRACGIVALRYKPARNDSGEEDPRLDAATVEKIYEEQRGIEKRLQDWRRQNGFMRSITAEDFGALDRLRLEHVVEAERGEMREKDRQEKWVAAVPDWARAPDRAREEWLQVMAAYIASKDANCPD